MVTFAMKVWNSRMPNVAMKAAFVALLAAGVAAVGQVAQAQQVGTAAAVNPAAQARGAGGSRTIIIGQSIAHRERIQTTSAGSVQLLFLDKTSMTIGPNSDLAIDEYVYDPGSNTGKLAATLSKGVMRFVGGQVSHSGNAQISTPNAVVGIRGGVGIFQPNSVFIGYGQGEVRSGSETVTLGAGEYTQTLGGGTPPTNPGPPPANFLQTVLAHLQSQAGQGGGARATAGQVNNARTAASGTPNGTIATNVQNLINQTVVNPNQSNGFSQVNQAIRTTANETRTEQQARQIQQIQQAERDRITQQQQQQPQPQPQSYEPQYLTGYTGGLVSSRNNYGPFGPIIAALGGGYVQTGTQNENQFAVFSAVQIGHIGTGAYNPYATSADEFQTGGYIFGPNTTNATIDDLAVNASVLLPATGSNGAPAAVINGEALNQFAGGVVEFKPGSALSQAASQTLGVTFCQCEYTKWGLWAADTTRTGQNANGGPVRDSAEMFWVAGRLPANASDVPATGSATYTGHAIANIRNGSQQYVSAAPFQNRVDFGQRTGNVTINGFDGANYAGQVIFPGDPRFFGGVLSASNVNRSMLLYGNFFQSSTSPVGEMGGTLQITGAANYGGAGIFIARR